MTGLRIAHFSDTFLPRRDGVITSIRTLAGALAERGHESVLFAPGYPAQTPVGFPVIGLPSVPCGVADLRLATWPRSRQVARVAAVSPDVVHVHTPGPAGLLGVLAAARLGKREAMTNVGLHFLYGDGVRRDPKRSRMWT